ncbi:MAG TPA: hypothetical protein VFF30_00555 [Nitrososphaerales archaeon]|nr:hypothetical protein [Nitrososphaerales archaeon]
MTNPRRCEGTIVDLADVDYLSSEQRKKSASDLAPGTPLHLRRASPDLDWKTRFRIIAAKASRNNRNPLTYSTTEAPIREELVKMGFIEGKTFLHEHRIFGYLGKNGQNVYFWLDFYLPDLKLGIEADGEVWHQFFDLKKRDRNRDATLARIHGVKIVRFDSYDLRRKRLGRKLSRVIRARSKEWLNGVMPSSKYT